MYELTLDQQNRIQKLFDHYKKRAEKKAEQVETGESTPGTCRSAADSYRNIGYYSIYYEDFDNSIEQFRLAAKYYLESVRESKGQKTELNTFRRIPATLVEGLYTTGVSGDSTQQKLIAEEIFKLPRKEFPPGDYFETPVKFNTDKYYLAQCLAGVILDNVRERDIKKLEEINRDKSETDALYGRAILQFTKGFYDDDPILIGVGIESMLKHHKQEFDEESIKDKIMCLKATALLITSCQRNYDIDVDSEFIPNGLVTASLNS